MSRVLHQTIQLSKRQLLSSNNPTTTKTALQQFKHFQKTTSSTPILTSIRHHGGPSIDASAPTISLTFHDPKLSEENKDKTVTAKIGESLLQTAHRHDIDLEGACEGVCACSTCHVILEDGIFDSLEEASEDEEDMLDMAFGLTDTSRLGCQVIVREDMEGMVVELPAATRNFYVDGHVPKPH